MKTSLQIFGAFALALTVFASCSPNLTPFTERLYQEYQWSENELKQIQFYLSEDLVLRRQLSAGNTEILAGGKIRVEDGRQVEEILIERGTPGVFMFSPKKEHFAISFEDDDYLMFGPNPRVGNKFVLLGKDWTRGMGTVTYGGREFRVKSEDAYAGLLVNLKKIRKTERRSRVAGGRRVGG